MNEILQAIILGLIQGLTEWIPVSSSAHLVIFQELFNIKASILFDVIVQVASLIALLYVFRSDLLKMFKSVISNQEKEYRKFTYLIILATLVTVIIAMLFREIFESAFTNLILAGICLIITGIILFLTKFTKETKSNLSLKDASLIGLAQGIAIFPGISRSGSTIATGMFLGIKKEESARFSFILFIPTMIGAAILQLTSSNLANENLTFILVGFLVSLIVSFLTLKWLLRIIKTRKFHYFYPYCLALGLLALIIGIYRL